MAKWETISKDVKELLNDKDWEQGILNGELLVGLCMKHELVTQKCKLSYMDIS